MHGDHKYRQFIKLGLDILDEIQTAGPGERNIHKHHIGLGGANASQRLGGVGGVTANSHGGLAFDQLAQAFAEHGVVVHDEDAARRGGHCSCGRFCCEWFFFLGHMLDSFRHAYLLLRADSRAAGLKTQVIWVP